MAFGSYSISHINILNLFTLINLELEDVVKRSENTAEVFAAITELLAQETARTWQYIKFTDSVRVTEYDGGEYVDMLLEHYAEKRQQLCDQVAPYAANKPIMFQLKVEVAEDTSLASLLELLRHLKGMHLVRIEFGGALFATRGPGIADKLARLCSKSYQNGSSLGALGGSSSRYEEGDDDSLEDENPYLHEMIMFSLFYAGVDTSAEASNSTTQLLEECILQLENVSSPKTKSTPLMEDLSKNSTHSDMSSSSRRRGGRKPKKPVIRSTSKKDSLDTDESMRLSDEHVADDNSAEKQNQNSKSSVMSSSSKRRSPRTTKYSTSPNSSSKNRLDHHSSHSHQQRKALDNGKGIPKCQARRCKSTDDGTTCTPDFDWSMNLSSQRRTNSTDKRSSSSSVAVPDSCDDKMRAKPPDFRWDKE